MHTQLTLKDESKDLHTDEPVVYCTEGLPVVECTTVKEEFKDEKIDTEDPLSFQIHKGALFSFNICQQCFTLSLQV